MIKYVEYDAFDEHGQHIISVNDLYHMNKMASGSYSPELMKVILNMKRRDDRYYVVINALGSGEVWGCNRNGDFFPESGLTHKSLRTDMGTINEYGYKTFEYLGRLYKHHCNKDPDKSFGDIIFSHWNPIIHRVELIVAININNGKDIIEALDKGEQVSVSMGCRVRYDRCVICDNKASTRGQYCKHLKNYMGQIVDKNLADQWSKETGKRILPGSQVFAFNDFPKFFDISRVYIGADRTSYILGKAASKNHIQYSVDIADTLGVTDDMIDKLAMVRKKGEIDKEISGALGPTDIDKPSNDNDGIITNISEMDAVRKSLDEKINNTIVAEPQLPTSLLNSMSSALPLETIFSTMFGLGIHPKPVEVQRIVLVRLGEKNLADDLEDSGTIFDTKDNSDPIPIDISDSNFSDTLGRTLMPFLNNRSCFPSMLGPRIQTVIIKTAEQLPWNETEKKEMKVNPALTTILGGLAALYAGLKLKAMGYGPADLISIFNKPWLRTLISGSIMWKIYNEINKQQNKKDYLPPAYEYANGLPNTKFSGHIIKEAAGKNIGGSLGYGLLGGGLILPAAYISNSWNQKSMYERGSPAFTGAGTNPITASVIGTAGITAAHHYGSKLKNLLLKKV